jgi:lysophospholipase L1-like esterase
MKEHSLSYSQPDKVCEIEESCDEAFHTNLIKKMPAFLGSKLVSLDKIHPNDQGYDYWGRHIASAIVKEWKHSR